MSGRETILPVAVMLLFGVGSERSDEVLKNRSSPSLGLFIWQGSDGSGGIICMFISAWSVWMHAACAGSRSPRVLRLARRKIALCQLRLLVCDVHRRIDAWPVGFDLAASRFPAKTRDHAAHDARSKGISSHARHARTQINLAVMSMSAAERRQGARCSVRDFIQFMRGSREEAATRTGVRQQRKLLPIEE